MARKPSAIGSSPSRGCVPLGYTWDEAAQAWDTAKVFPNWAKNFPTPPDLIGVTRTYSREVDEPVLRAVQSLQRSVPKEHKENLRVFLKPLGWTGYKMDAPAHKCGRRLTHRHPHEGNG